MKTLLRACAWSFVVLVLLAAGLYLAQGLQRRAEIADHQDRALADVTEQMPEVRKIAATEHERVLRRLDAEPAAYAWQELQCSVQTEEGGLMVMYYEQECWIRTVDLVPVRDGGRPDGACTTPPLKWGPSELTSSVALHRGPADAFDQETSFDQGCFSDVLAPRPGVAARLLDGERPSDLAGARAWLVVQIDTPLTRSTLGCDPWTLVFCESPVDGPVLPDAS